MRVVSQDYKIKVIEIHKLHPHELINGTRFEEIKEELLSTERIFPIIVDQNSDVILDGHHRYNVLKTLGFRKIPVISVDYNNENIGLFPWREGEEITKEDVIRRGISGELYPPKTSRHVLGLENPITVPLKSLR
ncbi:transcriptional regulator [Candidatus Woesearchaeota archaeon CG_4_10_14_0_2_um_filter_33_13]|nr:MAG: transcriptional regulator [Candidatus Woesearchaeota archaeon CG_4_10_14_0_2_um_filter_33_13]